MKNKRVCAVLSAATVACVVLATLSGCDYWPPALQAQIEQLRSEAKQAATERATLEEQLNSALKLKDEMQTKVEDLGKANENLTARVAGLEQALLAEREKMAKMIAVAAKTAPKSGTKANTKTAAKAMAKSASKSTAHGKPGQAKAGKPSQTSSEKKH